MSALSPVLHRLLAARYRGVKGVTVVDSGVPGPVAAILACTHGDELAGLHAIDYILSDLRLRCGRLFCIIVNPQAALAEKRYLDHNMNRLPIKAEDWANTVEGSRLVELQPVLKEVNGGVLDLHSTSAPGPTMLITADDYGCSIARCPSLPFRHIISGITPFLKGRFMIQACDQAPVKLLAECGQHQCPEAATKAIEMSIAFLQRLAMIEPQAIAETPSIKECYRVFSAIYLPRLQPGFKLVKPIEMFERLAQNQPIASNGETTVTAPAEGYAIMCPRTNGVLDNREALLFMCQKE